ncbi:MAG: molybdopterin-guanine dinucleotide biosynthesis protein A [Isosphaera sp.]|nr:molybdopterin-guanine dinucleotide biosynthesis protein A [Isosphaera sp.]
MTPRVAGIVLCGGRSSRMGRPKAWLPFGDELLLRRVVRVVREAVGPVVVVAAPGQDVPPLPADVEVVRDEAEGLGPLGGLAAGLAALAGRADAAHLSSCDVPFLTAAFVRRVVSFLSEADRPAVAVPVANGYHHPLAAAYAVSVLPQVRALLAAGRLRMTGLFDAVPTRVLTPDDLADTDSLRNVNTPDEYAAALARMTDDR